MILCAREPELYAQSVRTRGDGGAQSCRHERDQGPIMLCLSFESRKLMFTFEMFKRTT